MGQPQPDIIDEAISVEEFTDLFEPAPAQGLPSPGERLPCQGLPVEEAALILNLSIDTIKKRLRKGTLPGFKVQEKFGEKWLVSQEALAGPAQALQDRSQGLPSEGLPLQGQALPGPSHDHRDQLIKELQAKLEGATYRVGYLEAKLEDRDTQIKLLTDSQHRAGWWTRFCQWLVTGSGGTVS